MNEYDIDEQWQRTLDRISNLKVDSVQKKELLTSMYQSMSDEEQEEIGNLDQYLELM